MLPAVFASTRWGELTGLCRGDIDLDQAVVSIERPAVEVGKAIVVKTPETAADVRVVSVPTWLVPELRQQLDAYGELGIDRRVFTGQFGATQVRRNFATIWKRAKAKVGVPVELHSTISATPGTTSLRPREPAHRS